MSSKRMDNRKAIQLRPFVTNQGLLSNADGSAEFCSGNHSITCGVYGPIEGRHNEILGEAHVEVNYKPSSSIPGPETKLYEVAVRKTFDHVILKSLHPRSMIQINLQPLNIDGEQVSLAINCTMLALIDSGLPLSSMLGAVSCSISDQGTILLDPTTEEISSATSVHTFVFSSEVAKQDQAEIVFNESVGVYTFEQYSECFRMCLNAAKETISFLRDAIPKK
ncbi:exosome non-catalytic core subunit rrp46 [Entomophthora muscae]|uniref:Exosome non-catalytic core subunit rrp46 n=1 Tax=Entomophthora muscae TaxID=34485 RepID=A0ACC2RTT6_9FUNG|nr:exosome non-catalytic core subunit rrp46 [Entomophthora muscae]